MRRFKDFPEFEAHLDSLGLFRMDLTLGRMEAFLRASGEPEFPAVQVVGTNGKGSTATFLAALFSAHGLRAGLYTSPHFVSIRERLLVDGAMLPEAEWVELADAATALADGLDLTYFELLTCMAVLGFRRAGARAAIWEAGLGGSWDATRALPADIVLFTPIGLDHEAILGPGLERIARDKAGAMRPGGLALTGPQEPLVLDVLFRRAEEVGATLLRSEDLADLPPAASLGLAGPHQRENARLALAAWRLLVEGQGWSRDPEAQERALSRAFIPGRMQRVAHDPPLILDGAHNAHALAALAAALREGGVRPAATVFACLKDKDLEPMIPLILALGDGPILVPGIPDNERAMPPEELAARLGPRARPWADLGAALNPLAGSSGPVLVCGSLYLLAEFYKQNPWSLTRPQAA
ncbi:bifunctional folylpolyglutamate synthase/dihydrofolate synthase [Desulfovibrio aminophilus]|nr:cyanophycin synthetase [Desulfovibrio aminophilus]MCM0754129.1 bifunctional folylpolyglutamate synthase/dihydrofolate synthase [Desulfovibrio aminophilus]